MYRLYIFGAGQGAQRVKNILSKDKADVVAYLDNNVLKHGQIFNGSPILSPSEMNNNDVDFILIGSQYYSEIKEQLSSLGIDSEKIVRIFNKFGYLDLDNDLIEKFFDENRISMFESTLNVNDEFELFFKKEMNFATTGKLLYVTHDMNYGGAQLLSLHILRVLKEHFRLELAIMSKSSGIFGNQFEKAGPVFNMESAASEEVILKYIDDLFQRGFRTAICNTVLTGDTVKLLKLKGFKVLSLIHEMPSVIESFNAESNLEDAAKYADYTVFPSHLVYEKNRLQFGNEFNQVIIRPQGLYKENKLKNNKEQYEKLRRDLDLPLSAKIVLGVGFADQRKGIDLFADVAKIVRESLDEVHFIWVGGRTINVSSNLHVEPFNKVIFVSPTDKVAEYFAGADLYLMTSREDPFPSVVMEAMDASVPVIGFKEAGGFVDIVNGKTGALVEPFNVTEMANNVMELLNDDEERIQKGKNAQLLIESKFKFVDYIYDLLGLLDQQYLKISVIVPNYEYEHYLESRLTSIVTQSYPVYEIIFLDDCSKDRSVEKFQLLNLQAYNRYMQIQVDINTTNSGSVFKQWVKGMKIASGDYIWIAEADDYSSPLFLEHVTLGFHQDPSVVLGYTQSKSINQDDGIISNDYSSYTNDISISHWKKNYLCSGEEEITNRLVVKNTIPNVSATVFKKMDISFIADDLCRYKFAGDWYFYVWLLGSGNVYYNANSLNYHRQHRNSVTRSANHQLHFDEIVKMQTYICENFSVQEPAYLKMKEYRTKAKEYLGL